MADIYSRMRQVEKRLNFVMNSIRMKGAIGNGLLKADGSPDLKIIEGSLAEFYEMAKVADEVINESDVDPSVVGLAAEKQESMIDG